MKKIFIGLLSVVATINAGQSSTTVNALITANETWNPSGSPYILNGDCEIGSSAWLTILPGTRIVATGDYKLIIKGGIRAIGKKDSLISFDSMSVYLNNGKSYSHSDNSGSYFKYCSFFSYTTHGYMVATLNATIGLDRCEFLHGYYGVYTQSADSAAVYLTYSTFKDKSYGYPVFGLHENSLLYLVGNQFPYFGQIILGTRNIIKDNFFSGRGVPHGLYTQSQTEYAEIRCNHFLNLGYGLFAAGSSNGILNLEIHENQFDSCKNIFVFLCNNLPLDSVHISDNNLLNSFEYHVYMEGCSGQNIKKMDIKNNFWGTIDTNNIKKLIYDYYDNAILSWVIDFDDYYSSPVSACWPNHRQFIKTVTHHPVHSTVYPNPTFQTVEVDLPNGDWNLQWFDSKGSLLSQVQFFGSKCTLETPAPKGVFLLRWTGNGTAGSEIVMVQD
jgi:hypothetical protein